MKKYKLSEMADKEFYHDEYGWITLSITMVVSGRIKTSKKGRYNNCTGRYDIQQKTEAVNDLGGNAVYTSVSRNYYGVSGTTISDLKLTRLQMLEREWEKEKLYCYGDSYDNGYGNRDLLPINNIKVKFLWQGKEVTKDTEVEAYLGERNDRRLLDFEIKEGLRVQYYGQIGTFVVTKVFEQPNQEDNLCVVERLIKKEDDDKNSFVVKLGEVALVTVPYEKYKKAPNGMEVFNQPLKELDFAAFCEYEEGFANLYWRPIDEASGYKVSLYKKYEPNNMYEKKIYLLEQFSVERNKHWLTIGNLIGNNYVAIIEAENRSGEVIARTRGIDIKKATGYPEWFREV